MKKYRLLIFKNFLLLVIFNNNKNSTFRWKTDHFLFDVIYIKSEFWKKKDAIYNIFYYDIYIYANTKILKFIHQNILYDFVMNYISSCR